VALLFALLLAPATTVAQSAEPARSDVQDPLAKAQAHLDAGTPDAAIALLSSLAAPEADDPKVGLLLGLAHYQKSDFARAVEYLSAAAKRFPDGSPEYRQNVHLLGLSKYYLGQVKEALPYLEQVAIWSPRSVEISYMLGVGYIQIHDVDKARVAFARMFDVPPDSASARLLNARMMMHQRFEELAETELRQALALDPKLPEANFLLGELMVYRAEIDLGIELFRKEIAVNPAFGMAHYMLGEAYTRQLKWDEALGPLQKSIWLNPYFSGPYIVLGKVYLKKGDLRNAEGILRRAAQMDPNNFSAHHLLGQVLQQANRPAEAKAEFDLAERLRTGTGGRE
jgi:tetratricopeptide (TPR) repeat protein